MTKHYMDVGAPEFTMQAGKVFRCTDGFVVKLREPVSGKSGKWRVYEWCAGWCDFDSEIEPKDLAHEISLDALRVELHNWFKNRGFESQAAEDLLCERLNGLNQTDRSYLTRFIERWGTTTQMMRMTA